jgi:hydroxymethylbilane synthase
VARDRELRLGTRGSQLALWQANTVAARIAETGGPACRIVVIKTTGDRLQDRPLSEAGGKRLFVKEIEDALLAGEVDLAVHSSKDMPVVLPEGLTIAGVLPREDPRDAMVLRASAPEVRLKADAEMVRLKADGEKVRLKADTTYDTVNSIVDALGREPAIGTGSVRRVAQLKGLFPGARFASIRGNLDTRLRKLDDGQHDALVLAAAGLRRLGFGDRITLTLPAADCVPAPGQGIVAVEIREEDAVAQRTMAPVNDVSAHLALTTERAVVTALGGGCQTPVGALASLIDAKTIEVVAVVAALDGGRIIRAAGRGAVNEAAALGARIAQDLIAQGADEILAEARVN